jgi:glycosyltransferase involved in cell wall biosynthesis
VRINYAGHLIDATGYGEAARRMVQAIARAGGDIRPSPIRSFTDGGPAADLSPWMQDFLAQAPHAHPDVEILHAIAADFPGIPRSAPKTIGFTCWETSRVPQAMIDGCKSVDHVVVPSTHNQGVFAAAGIPASRIPYPSDSEIDTAPIPVLASLKCPHVFYAVASRQARKNLDALIIAFRTATRHCDTALIIKVGGSPMAAGAVTDDIARLGKQLNLPDQAPVYAVGAVSDAQLRWLHRVKGTCYLSMSRGEGFGLPMQDALMAGRAVIAPDWGGAADLLYVPPTWRTSDPSLVPRIGVRIIPSRLTPVVQDYPLFDGGQCWADPDILAAQQAILDEARRPGGRYIRQGAEWEPLTVGRRVLEELPQWMSGI